ncbi:hypothetical protein [Rheinheimera sp.]|uniref:hypothetical protein n=1 Tax=Rheinheimera sp. TaxID=1869214 RepID=UPI00307F7393
MMVILLSNCIFKDIGLVKRIIDMIFECSPRHTISSDQIRKILSIEGLDSEYKEKCKVILEKETNFLIFKNKIEVVSGSPSVGQVSFDNLNEKIFLNKSIVIVENSINDVRFLKYILSVCGKQKIIEKIDIYWEVSSNGGCGQIPGLTELKANIVGSNRVFVLHDSDRLYPQQNLSKTHTNIVHMCRQVNVAYHTLKKREPENYILDKVLHSVFPMDEKYKEAWSSLTNAQKSHYDYKIGFRSKSASDEVYDGLFNSLSDSQKTILKNGFGEDISELAFSSDLITEITESDIDNHCGSMMSEFKKIAESIELLL